MLSQETERLINPVYQYENCKIITFFLKSGVRWDIMSEKRVCAAAVWKGCEKR